MLATCVSLRTARRRSHTTPQSSRPGGATCAIAAGRPFVASRMTRASCGRGRRRNIRIGRLFQARDLEDSVFLQIGLRLMHQRHVHWRWCRVRLQAQFVVSSASARPSPTWASADVVQHALGRIPGRRWECSCYLRSRSSRPRLPLPPISSCTNSRRCGAPLVSSMTGRRASTRTTTRTPAETCPSATAHGRARTGPRRSQPLSIRSAARWASAARTPTAPRSSFTTRSISGQ
mmetsp:Transcript_87719/g.248446  ORF Transcript_87719/g.248446 Transcript_87719/m.248446 type:complete len:233 (+) Transcript_87719:339-1037(+)